MLSSLAQDDEDLGEAYQDERNQAALLLYRDREDGALLMDGTIGDDLVVKPMSARTRQELRREGLAPPAYRVARQQQQGRQQQAEDLAPSPSSLLARYLADQG